MIYSALAATHSKDNNRIFNVALLLMLSNSPIELAPSSDSNSGFQKDFYDTLSMMEQSRTKEEFSSVAKQFEELANGGLESGTLHFHCGNAWFQAGRFGNAIRHYRIAKFYLPGDSYLQANLEQALSAAPGRIDGQANGGIGENILFWSRWISHPWKIRSGSILLMASAFLFLTYALRGNTKLLFASIIGVIVSCVLLGEAVVRSPDRFALSYGVINSEATVRKGMGEEYAPAFDRPLLDGAEFEVLQRTSGWTLGRFPGIGDGWIKNEFVAGN